MAPAFCKALVKLFGMSTTPFVKLFRKSTPQEVDPYPSAQDGDQSTQGGELSARGDSPLSKFSSILRRFVEGRLLVADISKNASLIDVAWINAEAAMQLLLAKSKQYVDWVKENPRQATLIAACITIPIVLTVALIAVCIIILIVFIAALIAACVIILIVFPVATPLGAIGFSVAVPVAGSLAAALQACIGILGAGSLFVIVQSAAIISFGLPIVLRAFWGGKKLVFWGARALWNKFMEGSKDGDEPDSMAGARLIEINP